MLCPHSHVLRKFPEGHPTQNYFELSILNFGVPMIESSKGRCTLLVQVVTFNSFLTLLSCPHNHSNSNVILIYSCPPPKLRGLYFISSSHFHHPQDHSHSDVILIHSCPPPKLRVLHSISSSHFHHLKSHSLPKLPKKNFLSHFSF